jgi:hypothetical protein
MFASAAARPCAVSPVTVLRVVTVSIKIPSRMAGSSVVVVVVVDVNDVVVVVVTVVLKSIVGNEVGSAVGATVGAAVVGAAVVGTAVVGTVVGIKVGVSLTALSSLSLLVILDACALAANKNKRRSTARGTMEVPRPELQPTASTPLCGSRRLVYHT